ncbi:MAG TPA: type II toxin-antitoxin system VapC family toxin [Thermodesulfobacteriota bacterium]|nr:type II toxin-antitoxin system VapC family toxin [Thermodesulfobacteriota bacterium]
MRTFFDSSAFAKRYVDEAGSDAVDVLCRQAGDLGLSVICVPEIISALNRRLREKALSSQDYRKAKGSLAADLRDADVVNLLPAVIASCIVILESNPIRAMDALHVACALEWKAKLFVSSDKRQINAAKKAGLRARLV